MPSTPQWLRHTCPGLAQSKCSVLTPPPFPLLVPQGAAKPRLGGLRPRDSNLPVVSAAAPAERKSRRSMSQVLQDRSEVAVSAGKAARAPAACPPSPLPDIDSCDAEDPLAATDFVTDIFSYYKRVEPVLRVSPDYMAHQVGVFECGAVEGSLRVASCTVEVLVPLPIAPADSAPPLWLQGDINDKMRAILIDWLVDVHLKFKVRPCCSCRACDRPCLPSAWLGCQGGLRVSVH